MTLVELDYTSTAQASLINIPISQQQQQQQQLLHCITIKAVMVQGSYRNLTVVFQTFPGQDYFFFQTFQGILFIFM